MAAFLLTLHNIARWLVIIFAVLALVRAFSGWFGKKEWTARDDRAGLLFTMILDIQILLGIILYIFPGTYTRIALANFSAAMGDGATRFFVMEHLAIMVIAAIVAHVGRSMAKRVDASVVRHRRTAIWFVVSVLLILAAIPWPFFEHGRPLLRLFGITF